MVRMLMCKHTNVGRRIEVSEMPSSYKPPENRQIEEINLLQLPLRKKLQREPHCITGYQRVHVGLWCLTSYKQMKSQEKASLVLLLTELLDVLFNALLIH